MKITRKFVSTVAATSIALGLAAASAAPASAGVVGAHCSNGGYVFGVSNTTQVRTNEDVNCGTVAVRARYAHVGGTSWTTWSYHASLAEKNGLQNVDRAEHRGTYRSTFASTP